MTDVSVKLSVQVPGGPTIQSSRTVAVDTYEKIDVTLPPSKTAGKPSEITIPILKKEGLTELKLLLIEASFYSDEKTIDEKKWAIQYKIGEEKTGKNLVEPMILLGSEVIKALGNFDAITITSTYPDETGTGTDKKSLTKEHTLNLSILVGRVIPPPEKPLTPLEPAKEPAGAGT
jgi:hypothetical protein